MIVNVYSIYDRAAEEYGPTFEAKTDAVAWRFYDVKTRQDEYRHELFLVCIGTYDTESGVLSGSLVPREVVASVSLAEVNVEDV